MNLEEMLLFLQYNIHPTMRTIYLGPKLGQPDNDDTSFLMAETAIKNIHLLESISNEPITIIMSNSGGAVQDGNSIIDAIEQSPCHITIVCYGSCESMGVSILQAGDTRILSKNCTIMIHKSKTPTPSNINEKNHRKFFRKVDKLDTEKLLKRMKEINPSMSKRKLMRMLRHDTFLTAQEAIKLGIADKILDTNKHS